MTLEVWIAFFVASAVLIAIPGPTVMLVVSYALGRGKSSGYATVPGVTLGDFTAMTVSLLGAGALLAASATLFTALKLVGAGYLIWLGIRLWRATGHFEVASSNGCGGRSMFWHSYVVTALNPKSIVFFVAFVPQFVDPNAPVLPQFVILELTFLVIAAVNVALWAVLAGTLRRQFSRPESLRWVNRTGGVFLIGAGLLTATLRR